MTNHEIIESAKAQYAKEGVLKYTGNVFKVLTDDGKVIEVPEVEEIHTFNAWKEMGYKVRKGEHARCQIVIWKPRKKDEDEELTTGRPDMFMKRAHFFTAEQVEAI